jgi:hypothetical protein
VRLGALLVLSASIALVLAGTSAAATFRIGISGSSTQTVVGDPGPSTVQVSAASGVGGANPSGTIIAQTYTSLDVSSLTTFHGDVSQGCLLVQGNQAVAVGMLPVSEQFPVGSKVIEWAVAVVEDNGASSAGLDRAATGLLFDTSGTKVCNGTTSFASMISQWLDPGGVVDSGDYSFSYSDTLDGFPSNPDTTLTVVDSAGLPVTVTDEPDPRGLDVTAGAGTGTVKLDTCGGYEVDVAAGTDAHITCHSVIVEVVHGSAEIVLAGGFTTISVPQGGTVEVSGDETSGLTVQNLGTTPVGVTVNGVQGTIAPGTTAPVEAWAFLGFFDPVHNAPSVNPVKAGAAVPLKWRLLDSSGAPVTDLAAARLTVTGRNCTTGAAVGPTQPAKIVGPALQNLGGGYYQLNWKTLASYGGACETTHLDVGDGVTHDALFRFRS